MLMLMTAASLDCRLILPIQDHRTLLARPSWSHHIRTEALHGTTTTKAQRTQRLRHSEEARSLSDSAGTRTVRPRYWSLSITRFPPHSRAVVQIDTLRYRDASEWECGIHPSRIGTHSASGIT